MHQSHQASPSVLNHATFISVRNHYFTKIHRAHLSFCKGKLISLTLLLKNVSGPHPKKSSTAVTPTFPHLFPLVVL